MVVGSEDGDAALCWLGSSRGRFFPELLLYTLTFLSEYIPSLTMVFYFLGNLILCYLEVMRENVHS